MQADCSVYVQTSLLPQGELCISGVLLQCGQEADVPLEWVPSSLGSVKKKKKHNKVTMTWGKNKWQKEIF